MVFQPLEEGLYNIALTNDAESNTIEIISSDETASTLTVQLGELKVFGNVEIKGSATTIVENQNVRSTGN